MHLGDENGKTTYKYGALSFLNDGNKEYEFKLSDVLYSEYYKESGSSFNIGEGYMEGTLIVGREHIGDENGQTRYAYKKLYAKAKKIKSGLYANYIPKCRVNVLLRKAVDYGQKN